MLLSRHAKHNMKLYGIAGDEITETVQSPDTVAREGAKNIAIKKFGKKFSGYPLKVVYEKRGNEPFVITVYPLKKKPWR